MVTSCGHSSAYGWLLFSSVRQDAAALLLTSEKASGPRPACPEKGRELPPSPGLEHRRWLPVLPGLGGHLAALHDQCRDNVKVTEGPAPSPWKAAEASALCLCSEQVVGGISSNHSLCSEVWDVAE